MNALRQMIVLTSCPNIWEAEILAGRLQAEGIDAQLRDQHIVSTNWLYSNAVGGVKVVVPSEQFELAESLLASPEPEAGEEAPPAWGTCPDCASTQLTPVTRSGLTWLTSYLLIPLWRPRRHLKCLACGAEAKC